MGAKRRRRYAVRPRPDERVGVGLPPYAAAFWDQPPQKLGFFARLGDMVGFRTRRDWQKMDLSWHDPDESDRLVLYLERETERSRAIQTIRKLLTSRDPNGVSYLVAVLGWVKDSDLPEIRACIDDLRGERSLLLIAWVGEGKDDRSIRIEALVYAQKDVFKRSASPGLDRDDYWYIVFSTAWHP